LHLRALEVSDASSSLLWTAPTYLMCEEGVMVQNGGLLGSAPGVVTSDSCLLSQLKGRELGDNCRDGIVDAPVVAVQGATSLLTLARGLVRADTLTVGTAAVIGCSARGYNASTGAATPLSSSNPVTAWAGAFGALGGDGGSHAGVGAAGKERPERKWLVQAPYRSRSRYVPVPLATDFII
jgi:hypothetical protein